MSAQARLRSVVLVASLLSVGLAAFPAASSSHGVQCRDAGDDPIVLMEPASMLVGAPGPGCIVVDATRTVTFRNADVREHQIASADDNGACWKETLSVGEAFGLTLAFDGNHVNRTLPTPSRVCDSAVDTSGSSATHALVWFKCRFHPSFQGGLLVNKSP